MKIYLLNSILIAIFFVNVAYSQSALVGKEKHLIYHDIKTDANNFILPWYDKDPAVSFDHVVSLTWEYWKNIPGYWMRNCPNFEKDYGIKFPPLYFLFRTQDPADLGIGGGQFAMMLSSFNLYYDYTGNKEVMDNMVFQADWYINHGFSDSTFVWPNIPYPCNTKLLPTYDGDLILGKDFTQPDKAGDFGYELVILYKKTGNRLYLETAKKIANTLAIHTSDGDKDHSPIPFKVNAKTGEVGYILASDGVTKIGTTYTTNWTGTMRLFQQLISIGVGQNSDTYQQAFDKLLKWMIKYPVTVNRWGPFFEDIGCWSDTQINAGQMAWFIMDNKELIPAWKEDVQNIQKWVIDKLSIDYWEQYGLKVIGEQTAYKCQGQSHTSRHASNELRYAELTGDTKMVDEAIRQLSWCTYMVDNDGKNLWPDFDGYEIWWTDGYGDYIRHFLRAMAADPQLAPPNSNHLLRTSSVIKEISYQPAAINYLTFDNSSEEIFRLKSKPKKVEADGKSLKEISVNISGGWSWQPLRSGGVLKLKHLKGSKISITL